MSQDDFPTRVRAERKKRKWTQKELADRAHVSLRAIQEYEAGKSAGTPANRLAVLDALGLGDNPGNPGDADETREGWPTDVKVFLDVIGAYLMTMPEDVRLRTIGDLTRQIFEAHR